MTKKQEYKENAKKRRKKEKLREWMNQTHSLIGLAYINLKDMRNNNNNSNHSKYNSNHIATPW